MFRKYYLLIALPLLVSSQACGLFSKSNEFVTVATEVGEATGPAATKSIGPEGGSIASPDGRMTLKIPPNVVPAAINFSIQPITNKAEGGLGNAYRLEPDGQKFAAPVEISLKYDDHDLEGTVPEALTVAYQDENKAWHLQKLAKLDQAAKTLTVSTRHFTDWSWLARVHLEPAAAKLYVGETQEIFLMQCKESGLIDWVFGLPAKCLRVPTSRSDLRWSLDGKGEIVMQNQGATYYTPARKPSPNVAVVHADFDVEKWDENKLDTMHVTLFTTITIVDRGYKVSGTSHDTVYSGVVCDLEKPFTVNATGLASFAVKFVPLGPTSGTASYSSNYGGMVAETGKGTYTVGGVETEKPTIIWTLGGTATVAGRSTSASGTVNLDLTPLGPNEDGCGGG